MKKKIAIILDLSDMNTFEFNKNTIFDFVKLLDEIYIIDVSKIINLDVKSELLSNIPNSINLKPNNLKELKSILKKENLILMYCLNNDLKYFFINFVISIIGVKKFVISNLGYNPENFNYHEKQKLIEKISIFLKLRFYYYFIRMLILLKIIPRIDYFFESSSYVINSINNGISKKINNRFKWLDLSYYKNVIKINSRSYDYILKNKSSISEDYIVFIDGMLFEHKDRILREGKPDIELRKKYYNTLNNFLKMLENKLKKKVIVCLHPQNLISENNNDFNDFKCIKYKTEEYISKAYIVVFHEGSSIIQAIVSKKKIINLYGEILGNYINKRCNMYSKILNLKSYNLNDLNDLKLIDINSLESDLGSRISNYDRYINENIVFEKNISSSEQIINYFKKNQ